MMRKSFLVLCAILMAGAFLTLVLPKQSTAIWHTVLYETFEHDQDTWPWDTWTLRPWPPQAPNRHTWGVEDSAVYYPGPPGVYRSAWCSGLPNDLIPGTDNYRVSPNEGSWARWGSFDLSDAVEGEGSMKLWATMESDAQGNGDDFHFLINTGGTPFGAMNNLGSWDHLFEFNRDFTAQRQWEDIFFDFAYAVEPGGDTVSYLGEDNVFVSLLFEDDGDNNRGLGAFVDNLSMGYDDGEYNLTNASVSIVEMGDDGEFEENPTVAFGDTIGFKLRYSFVGPNTIPASDSVSHVLEIDEVAIDSVRGLWSNSRYGDFHIVVLGYPYVPQDTGRIDIRFTMDINDEQDEGVEDDNVYETFWPVGQPQSPPELTFIQPAAGDTIEVGEAVGLPQAEIVYTAIDYPDYAVSHTSLYYSTVYGDESDILIPGAENMDIRNGTQERVYWDVGEAADADYYIYAIITDYIHPPETIWCEGVFRVWNTAVQEGENSAIPQEFSITQVYPNPFNPTVEINFGLPRTSDVSAQWYSLDGRLVNSQQYNGMGAGHHVINWTPQGVASGMYLLRLNSALGTQTAKVLYVR
ncbi:T9SS type A sorting domain-containing protein [bacterium]|nr:T9SS type A sorting domain-containing protein [bacterium]